MYSEVMLVRSIARNVFIIDITMNKLEEGDYKENIENFGEDAIEIGGAIVDDNDVTLATIPSRRIRISELPNNPVRQKFAKSVYGEKAKDIALAWYEQTKARITDYVSTKIAKFDDFSMEETIHI